MNSVLSIPEGAIDSAEEARKYRAAVRDSIQTELDEIQAQYKELADEDIPQLEERVFVNVFLPMFSGIPEKNIYKVTMEDWVKKVSGNHFKPVNVIDSNKNILFQVPAISNREMVSPLLWRDIKSSRITDVLAESQQHSKISPTAGAMFQSRELQKRALIMSKKEADPANLEAWNAIFKRYGLQPIAETVKGEKQEDETANYTFDDA